MKRMTREEVAESILRDHNHSWYEDIYMRNANRKDRPALFYRGVEITYGEFFSLVERYAKSLREYGIGHGDEFIACLQQTPDYPILVAAASLIGAKINLISAYFDAGYVGTIIDQANAGVVLVCDWDFVSLAQALSLHAADKKIIVLPADYWYKGQNPYAEITDRYFVFDKEAFENKVAQFSNVIFTEQFLKDGERFQGEISGHTKLDDDMAITYTSGTTSKGIHKGIVQKNRTYIIMGRYHDPEVAGIPPMDHTVTLSAIGPHADTTMMSGVSDTLLQGGTFALEPIIDEHYFLQSLIINRPGLAIATRCYWLRAMKLSMEDPAFLGLKLPYLYVPSEGGEPLSAGEEKALNRWLFKMKAGTAITHTPFSIVKMSVGGGDSEHGSLFLSLYRGYKNLWQRFRGIREPVGLKAYDFADVQVLREDGSYCDKMEMGRLVANSPASMERYHNNPEATEKYFITDRYGHRWGDLAVYGYVDKWNNVYLKGRIGTNDPDVKPFEIADEILFDSKNIMSCEVLYFQEEEMYVAHVEMQYRKRVDAEKALNRAKRRCEKRFGIPLTQRLAFRVRSSQEGYPLLFTAKRDIAALRREGIPS